MYINVTLVNRIRILHDRFGVDRFGIEPAIAVLRSNDKTIETNADAKAVLDMLIRIGVIKPSLSPSSKLVIKGPRTKPM